MLKSFTIPTCLALGLAVAAGQSDAQVVREGARRTGQAVAEGGRAVAQGTRNAINRTGQATRNVIDGTTDAARARVDRLERSELQPGADANLATDVNAGAQARAYQDQPGANIGANQQLDGSAYSPLPGDARVDGQYEAGYRGLNDGTVQSGQANFQGRAYQLRHDRYGREFICVNGRAVYFDNRQNGQPQQHEAYKLDSDQMMNQDTMYHQQNQREVDIQSRQYQGSTQNGAYIPQGAPPAPPAPVRTDLNDGSATSSELNTDSTINADQETRLNDSADTDADIRAGASTDTQAAESNADASADASLDSTSDASASSSDASADANLDSSDNTSSDADASADADVEANSDSSSDAEDSSSNDSGESNN